MSISIIVAAAENNVIGIKNKLPWKLSGDLKHFAQLTTGKTVVMGMNTYRSILATLGKPLPNRRNLILTFQPDSAITVEQVTSWEPVQKLAESKEIFVIGGASVYVQAIDLADKIYLTRVHASPEGDTYFPAIDETRWKLASSQEVPKGEKDEYNYAFQIYERTK